MTAFQMLQKTRYVSVSCLVLLRTQTAMGPQITETWIRMEMAFLMRSRELQIQMVMAFPITKTRIAMAMVFWIQLKKGQLLPQ